jgi:serine/threonine protein kinase/tetratricopeptide (TPR) repeat protein
MIAGKFKVLECLGEGGMGTVYVAEQTQPVRRKVALKVVKPGLDSSRLLARFEAERQALALMDHPNIAKVFDAGLTEQGRPFFVMEYIKGVPLTEYCDAARLAVPVRLALFMAVCQAVHHAHQKGIIHRDLKPSNLLVALYDDRPVPKVIDFGLAKALHQPLTERTLYTAHEMVVGTPLYMSPEQAELNNLDIDTRSDIYALGVVLYELLTGATPLDRQRFKEAAWNEMLRMIREEEPPRPSTRLSGSASLPSVAAQRQVQPARLTRLLRGELDWIVMKALEKDRGRRYESANGFAQDIQRYLAEEPVLAGPPSVAYRLRKFARRHRVAVFLTLFAPACLLAILSNHFIASWRIRTQRDQALAAAAAEKTAKEIAMTRAAETQAVLDFVEQQILAAAQPEGLDGGRGRDLTLRQALEEALPFVETRFKDQPLIEARLRLKLGLSFWRLGEGKIAAAQCERARELYARHLGPDHPDTLASLGGVANSYSALGRHADALKLREEVVALCTRRLGPDHPDTLRCRFNLAVSYAAVGRGADALKLNQETLALMKARLGPDHPDTLKNMDNLATDYTAAGRPAEALKLHEEALALLKARRGPDHPDTLLCQNNLCACYRALNRHADAVKLGEQTVPLLKDRLGPRHRHTFASMWGLSVGYDAVGRYEDAARLGEETLALQRTGLGRDHAETVETMLSLAYTYASLGRHADALRLYEEALAIRKVKLGPGHRDTLACMNNMAGCYKALGRLADAVKLQEETLALRKDRLGRDDPDTLFSMTQLVQNYAAQGRYADAARLLEEMLPLQKARFGADHANTLKTMHDLAYCHSVLGRHDDSLRLIEKRLALMKAKLGPHHRETLLAMNDRANHYANFGRREEALKLRQELVPLMKAHLGPGDPDTLGSMTNLALSYAAFGRHVDAARLNEATLTLSKDQLAPNHPTTLLSRDNLAVNYAALGRHADALKPRQESLALRKATLGTDHPDTLWSTWGVAESLVALDRGAEAVALIDGCLKRVAGRAVDPGLVPGLLDVRLRRFEKAKDAAGCRATAEMWEKLNRTDAASLYRAAWMRAVTAAVLRAGNTSADSAKQAAAEADRAMAWLKQAVAAGYTNAAHLKKDRALDVLRDRDDFKKLLAVLEAGREKGKK